MPNKGYKQTEEHIEKVRLAHLGKKHPMTWIHPLLGKRHSSGTKRKIAETMMGNTNASGNKGKTITKDQLKKMLRRHIPTSLEEKFQSIVDKYNLPYKYVGDGSFIIGRYNPDFINTNSEKIAVEVYARYYKKRNNISIEDWKIQRSNIFRQYGWQIMYFNEIEVNEENILNKLNEVK